MSFHVKAESSTGCFPINSGSQSRGKVRGNPAPQSLEAYFEFTRVPIPRPRGVFFLRKFSQSKTDHNFDFNAGTVLAIIYNTSQYSTEFLIYASFFLFF